MILNGKLNNTKEYDPLRLKTLRKIEFFSKIIVEKKKFKANS